VRNCPDERPGFEDGEGDGAGCEGSAAAFFGGSFFCEAMI